MPTVHRIDNKQDFLRLEVSGQWTPGKEAREAMAIFSELAAACRQTGISRVIEVFDIPGRLPTMAAYDIASNPSAFGWDRNWKTALVFTYPERFESNLFTETVAVNRLYNIKAFRDESIAQAWLLGK